MILFVEGDLDSECWLGDLLDLDLERREVVVEDLLFVVVVPEFVLVDVFAVADGFDVFVVVIVTLFTVETLLGLAAVGGFFQLRGSRLR